MGRIIHDSAVSLEDKDIEEEDLEEERFGTQAWQGTELEEPESFAPESLADERSVAEELGEYEESGGGVTFPSGASLPIVTGPDATTSDEYWDPNRANIPLLDTNASRATTSLSTSFTVGELARSGSHRFEKARIDPALVRCLQAIRDLVGKPVRVNSGYRSWGYNKQLYRGRSQKPTPSRHCSGQAADIRIAGMTGLDVAKAAIDACGGDIGVGIDRHSAHIDVRGIWARWTYPGLGNEEARRRALTELDAHRSNPGITQETLGPLATAAAPALGGARVPQGFQIARNSRGLYRYGGGRLDVALQRLRARSRISITDNEIDTLQRIANVESSTQLVGMNTWDDAVMSVGFMQLTLKWGELQKWIARAPAAFARYGISLDPGRTYTWGPKNRQTAIRGAADKDDLRWNGWAERFYKAAGDDDIVAAEVEQAREILRRQSVRVEGLLKDAPSALDQWKQHYGASAALRGMFHEGYNNRPVYALRAAVRASQSAPPGATVERFIQIFADSLVTAYGTDAQKARNIISKTSAGARLGVAGASSKTPTVAAPPAITLELVRFAQQVLNVAEGERLSDDGRLGPLTQAALQRFRTKYGLGGGGGLDEPTQIALAQRALEEIAQQSIFPKYGARDPKTEQALLDFRVKRGLGFGATLDAATRAAVAGALKPAAASPIVAPLGVTGLSLGIDTASVADNKNVSWTDARTRVPVEFAIIRSNWGVREDSAFKRDWPKMRDASVVRGAYLFLRFPHPKHGMKAPDPVSQANALIKAVGQLDESDLPPTVDVEFPGSRKITGLSAQRCLDGVRAAWKVLKSHYGVAPIVYTSARVWKEDLDNLPAPDLVESPLWLARYPSHAPFKKKGPAIYDARVIARLNAPPVPAPWGDATNWWIHQYQGDAVHLPGFPSGNVDMNRLNMTVKGATGDRVKWVQRRLGIAQSGVFDAATETALRAFQGRKGLPADGKVDARTFARLCWSNP